MNKKKKSAVHLILTIVGIVLCTILIPILAINITLLVKSYTNKDAVPNVGGTLPLIVLTESMDPVIKGGDLIFCHTDKPENVKTGDVIAFFDPMGNGTSVVTHRVIEVIEDKDGISWRTKGDANNAEDQALVPGINLVGVWSEIRIEGLGEVAMFMKTTTGLTVCVVLPLVLLVCYDIIRRNAYEKKQSRDTKQLMAELDELRKLKAEQEKAKEQQNTQ